MDDLFDPPTDPAARSAYLRRRAELARVRAQKLMTTISRATYQSDPAILGQVKAILAMPPTERLEMLMDELAVFASARMVTE
ncbi:MULTISPECIES: hypothetical protein [unclassified Pseudofrankia]|uniref:hypothetical protein n=1 Tax=unclassified Pseudofrankia TaxID=2994372 RepID=UPI001F51D27B|nr:MULTISPECIES: hypothetical protein [unclassified Pseudofrankia]MDT3439427.1 hypothetical protein [Pseudofrankia sp. BMG5.37]